MRQGRLWAQVLDAALGAGEGPGLCGGLRARAVRRAQREGRYDRLDRVRLVLDVERDHLRILELDRRETRPGVNALGPAARRRLFCRTPQGLEPLAVWLNEDGMPRDPHGWHPSITPTPGSPYSGSPGFGLRPII
jgi:hypothetical protein